GRDRSPDCGWGWPPPRRSPTPSGYRRTGCARSTPSPRGCGPRGRPDTSSSSPTRGAARPTTPGTPRTARARPAPRWGPPRRSPWTVSATWPGTPHASTSWTRRRRHGSVRRPRPTPPGSSRWRPTTSSLGAPRRRWNRGTCAGPPVPRAAMRRAERERVRVAAAGPRPAPPFLAGIGSRHTTCLAARAGGELVGYAVLAALGPAGDREFEVHTIAVDPAAQGRGI